MKFEYIVRAKSVDEAYKKALDLYSALGEITMDKIINPGKKGFLGLGSVLAEIKVTVDDGKEDRSAKAEKKEKPVEAPKPKKVAPAPEKAEKKAPKAPAAKPVEEKVKTEQKEAKPNAPKTEKKKAPKPQRKEKPAKEPLKNEDIKVTKYFAARKEDKK